MRAADLTEYLIAEIVAADGDTTFTDELLAKARARILAGGGEIAPLSGTSTSTGSTFLRDVRMSAVDVAKACRDALDYVNEDNGVASTCLPARSNSGEEIELSRGLHDPCDGVLALEEVRGVVGDNDERQGFLQRDAQARQIGDVQGMPAPHAEDAIGIADAEARHAQE